MKLQIVGQQVQFKYVFQMKRCLKFVFVAFLIGILPTESSSKKKGQGETKNVIVMVLSMKGKGQSKKTLHSLSLCKKKGTGRVGKKYNLIYFLFLQKKKGGVR